MRGTVRLLLDYDGVLGPNRPESDSTLHPLALSRCDAVELSEHQWKVIRFGQASDPTVLASGSRPTGRTIALALDHKFGGETRLYLNERPIWNGILPLRRAGGVRPSPGAASPASLSAPGHSVTSSLSNDAAPGDGRTPGQSPSDVLGIEVEPHSHLVVERFAIQGKAQLAAINYLFSEGILGAGGSGNDWQELRKPEFRYGLGAVAKETGARVKWNVQGSQFTLWSPRGPDFGKAQVKVDGRVLANLDLHAEHLTPAQPVWKSPHLKDGLHAVALTGSEGLLAVDSLEVIR